jgi:type IV pilus assembly protein PilQ
MVMFTLLGIALPAQAQEVVGDHGDSAEDTLRSFPGIDVQIASLKGKYPVAELLYALAERFDLNLSVETGVNGMITVYFSKISLLDALLFVISQSRLQFRIVNSVIYISKSISEAPVLKEPLAPVVSWIDDRLSIDSKQTTVLTLARSLTEITGKNIVVENGVNGTITGFIMKAPFETGLRTLLEINGMQLRTVDGIYRVDREIAAGPDAARRTRGRSLVAVKDSMVTLDVSNAEIAYVLQEITAQSDIDLFTYGKIQGTVTARISGVSIENALNYLFRGTEYTYRREQNVYFVGNKDIRGITSMEMIQLDHMKSEDILEMLPDRLLSQATFEVVRELNSLLVTGTRDVVSEAEEFIALVDQPSPQILLDVLVVDLRHSETSEFGFTASQDTSAQPLSTYFPGIEISYPGDDLENFLSAGLIARLPPNFRARFRALEQEGIVSVRSQPRIATLSGHEASISIGTTQYFLLESQGIFSTPGAPVSQTSQRFERIEANAILKITPWVSASGEITTIIHPEFNTPVGALNADVPPTIDSRIIDSTVRLRDGETIILGGMIEESERSEFRKFPLLGDIPWLGRLFRYSRKGKVKNQLIILVTPHLYYGSEGSVDVEHLLKIE